MKAPPAHRLGPYHMVLRKKTPMQVDAEIFASKNIPVESEALNQLADAACLPGVERVLATPDIHVGFGVPIGGVVAARNFISPAAVGYDINCGMRLITTPFDAREIDVPDLARNVRKVIPLGEGKSNVRLTSKGLRRVLAEGLPGLLSIINSELLAFPDNAILNELDQQEQTTILERVERHGNLPGNPQAVPDRAKQRGLPQLGTLGGGNHFIEFQLVDRIDDSETAKLWGLRLGQLVVMIHSGSRGLGHEIGGHFMRLAGKFVKKHGIKVPSSNLAILPLDSREGRDYLGAMNAAANYAFANRHIMAILVQGIIRRRFGSIDLATIYDVAHNLASLERHARNDLMIHRKGATRAFPPERMKGTPFAETGQPVLVPGSMGTASWLLRGIPAGQRALYSTNHGAGRVLSRTAARGRKRGKRGRVQIPAAISDEDVMKSMQGITLICEKPGSIKEEAPAAYKDIDAVIESVIGAELAAAVARMVPLAVLKG
ncbi:MAG: RtcB family protein [Deltaproteobacteria bacterium]|nr:RtcB family protein [Deltaproteobacteria bacterium]